MTVSYADTPSESGYGWTNDGSYPFWPGVPCVHCGKFVGRDGIFNVEHFEMSTEIASMDAEHRDCSSAFHASMHALAGAGSG